MSVEEAARMIGVGRTSIYAAIASGALKARKFGSRTLILAEDAKSFLSALSEVSAA
jgi:excisionase family DNA binding protein